MGIERNPRGSSAHARFGLEKLIVRRRFELQQRWVTWRNGRLSLGAEFGARLDQWADFALWVSFPVGAWWLWPEIVLREAPYVILAIVCLLLPTTIAYTKYRSVPGYHTWSAKLSAVLMGVAVPLLLIFDFAWPFRVSALFLVVSAVDELGITILLAECRHDVPSVLHASRLRGHERC